MHATAFYDVEWDPSFTGQVKLSVDESCLSLDGTYPAIIFPTFHPTQIHNCFVSLVFANLVDSDGNRWVSGPQSAVGLLVSIVGNSLDELFSRPIALEPVVAPAAFSLSSLNNYQHDNDCDAFLQFFMGGGTDTGATLSFSSACPNAPQQNVNGYTLVRGTATSVIPEPGTLALLVGGIGAGWLSRRRKTGV